MTRIDWTLLIAASALILAVCVDATIVTGRMH
jgi:hypothetical protein